NHAYAVGPRARTLKVLRVGAANPFLDALLGDAELVEQTHVANLGELGADANEQNAALAKFDLAVFDRSEVPVEMSIPWLGIATPGGAPGVEILGSVDSPVAAFLRDDNSLLQDLDLRELAIAEAQKIDAPAATTVMGSEDTPLLVQGSQGDARFVYLGFALDQANLGLLPAFPILADRIITTLGGADLTTGELTVGDPLSIDVGGGAGADTVVTSPSGVKTTVRAGELAPELDRAGIWVIESGAGGSSASGDGSKDGSALRRLAVVNPPPAESAISPRKGLAIPGVDNPMNDAGAPVRRSIVTILLVLACAVVVAEWFFSSRRRGVGLKQWRVATGLRAAVLLSLILALVIPSLNLRTSKVGVVFVVDVSDSMGSGREKAVDAVKAAIEVMPSGSVAGVVAVGGDARVDASVAESLKWNGVDVLLDGSATDLGAGVRVAGAMAPSDHARRVVLVSDGRPNAGNLDAELRRLRRAGVRLDVMPIDANSGPDVMVRSVETPDRARPSDAIIVTAKVHATKAQRVSVALKRNDVEVDRKLVDLPAGDSDVEFTQPAGEPGAIRWSVSVAGPANGILQNDIARASTRVEGRAQVLVVEGSPGEAAELSAVLSTVGAQVEVVAPEQVTDLATLAGVDAVVLVNVPLSALSSRQVDAITTATRELGTGLVTIGGTSSYGAGEYLGSSLEEILPVLSEVRDPKRRSKVAQVFAVDVSGSMGACHCAEGGEGQNSRISNGMKKTDIARDAAVLSLDGIDPGDELGVLALDDNYRWVRDVSPVGDGRKASKEIGKLNSTEGGTNLMPGLTQSAERLKKSDASIRHIVLFTDGFEDTNELGALAFEAGRLREDGITVSVMGTGEGAAPQLRAIAEAGGGRYYPGRDLNALPNLLLQETKVVSRQLIVEGEFLPERTSDAAIVSSLSSAPPVGGYIATTARPTAVQHLRVGPERDPLLASWQVGLGQVVSWTSDAGGRWGAGWMSWDGAPTFWADVLRSVYRAPAGSLQVGFNDSDARAVAEFDTAVPDGAKVNAVVVSPDGSTKTVPMRRMDDRSFEAQFPTSRVGTYAIGATAFEGTSPIASVTGVGELGYSQEYGSAPPDHELLKTASLATKGRGAISPGQVFDPSGLEPGHRSVALRNWLLMLAALLWPIAVAVSRLRFATGPDAVLKRERLGRVGAVADAVRSSRPARRSVPNETRPEHGPHGQASSSQASQRKGTPSQGSGAQASEAGSGSPAPTSATSAAPPKGGPSTGAAPPKGGPSKGSPSKRAPSRRAPSKSGGSGGESDSGSTLDSLLAAKRERRRFSDSGESPKE
ncbi:MAG TPA: VWA domain-containing protein, partial [Microthrixaceae bacterium]|nr:VWA domain-containing protein [Microthrixaceae bacterium]